MKLSKGGGTKRSCGGGDVGLWLGERSGQFRMWLLINPSKKLLWKSSFLLCWFGHFLIWKLPLTSPYFTHRFQAFQLDLQGSALLCCRLCLCSVWYLLTQNSPQQNCSASPWHERRERNHIGLKWNFPLSPPRHLYYPNIQPLPREAISPAVLVRFQAQCQYLN